MIQYDEIKSSYTDSILLFRMGDFYETFGDDAALTSDTKKFPFPVKIWVLKSPESITASPPVATIKQGPNPPLNPNPLADAAPLVFKIGIILFSSYYANCVWDANAVNAASPVFIIVYE